MVHDGQTEIFIVDFFPVPPFLNDLFAVEQHGAEDDTGGQATTLLAVMDH
jgi:hypothetical protein